MSLSQLSFAFRCSKTSNAMRQAVVGNLGSDWLNCFAVYHWCRLILNLDIWEQVVALPGIISELPNNRGVAETKSGWKNGGPCNILVAVILRCGCGKGQCDAAGVISNFGGDWLIVLQSITGRFVLNLGYLGSKGRLHCQHHQRISK